MMFHPAVGNGVRWWFGEKWLTEHGRAVRLLDLAPAMERWSMQTWIERRDGIRGWRAIFRGLEGARD